VVVVVALFTTCFTCVEVLPAKVESPPYTASIRFVPGRSVEVVKLAEPPLNVLVPNTFVPFINMTASPSGGAPKLEVTVALKVTGCPYADGLTEDDSVVVVAAVRTT
jgi:hypothetical protein